MATHSKKSRIDRIACRKHTAASERGTRPRTFESLETRQMMAADMPAMGSFDAIHPGYLAVQNAPAVVESAGAIEPVGIIAAHQTSLRVSSTLDSFGSGIFKYQVEGGRLKINAVRPDCQVVVQRNFNQADGQWHLLIRGLDWNGTELQRRDIRESGISKIEYRGTTGRDLFANNTFNVNTDKQPLRQSLPSEAWGRAGNDVLYGGTRKDTFHGGPGWDELRGFGGNDTLEGGADGDRFFGGTGADKIVDYDPQHGDTIPQKDVEVGSGMPTSLSPSDTGLMFSAFTSDRVVEALSRPQSPVLRARADVDQIGQKANTAVISVGNQSRDLSELSRAHPRTVDAIFGDAAELLDVLTIRPRWQSSSAFAGPTRFLGHDT